MKEENKTVNVVFVLDRSGSMYPMKEQVIKGFNTVLRDHSDPEVKYTVCVFNDSINFTEVQSPADKVSPLDGSSYRPDGCTALNDAMGKTIKTMDKLLEKDDRVLFFVMTDGYENASTDYSDGDIRELVRSRTSKGWEFVFLGANIDVSEEAEKRGIKRSSEFLADDMGSAKCMMAMDTAVANMRSRGCLDAEDEDFDAELRKDVKERKRSRKA